MRTRYVAAVAVALALAAASPRDVGLEEHQLVRRGLLHLRLDPKLGSAPGECDDLGASEITITVGGAPVMVTSVERVPRPERHWLLLDISDSAAGRRYEAQRSARQYVREVMTPGLDSAALLTVDDDTLLIGGPTTDPEALAALVDHIPAGGGSALRDGLATVLRQVEGDRREHLILYWTDGHDTESILTAGDLMATLARAPNATIIPIALLPTRGSASGDPFVGAFLFDVARRSGGDVFASTDPRWLDRVRGWIARRFVVTFTPPEGASDRSVAVVIAGKRCLATVLPDPFERPDLVAGVAAPAPRSWVRIHAMQRKADDPVCAADPTGSPWDWPLRADSGRLAGCVLDIVEAPGLLVHGSGAKRLRSIELAPVRFAARDVQVEAPPFAQLPASLTDAITSLATMSEEAPGGRSPLVIEGSALLTQRARIAASLFAVRADYNDFARARLAQLAEDDLESIENDLKRAFPALTDAQLADVARASRGGRRAIDGARTPTDADLAGVLAAWLGDVPAWAVFRDWELRLVNTRLAGVRDPAIIAKWTGLRARFGQAETVRVAAPLILLHDRALNLVGFRRIVLPRPVAFEEQARHEAGAAPRVEDRVPDRPFALDVLDEALRTNEVGKRLAASVFRAVRIDYAPLEPAWKTHRKGPFRHTRVTLTLEAPGARLVLEAELRLAVDDTVTVVGLVVR